jgi:DNA-binding transcriptional MerR regulator
VLAEMAADVESEESAPAAARGPEPLQQFMRSEPAQTGQPQEFAIPAAGPAAEQLAPPPAPPGLDPKTVENLLAERDSRIDELEQAVVELSNTRQEEKLGGLGSELDTLKGAVAELANRDARIAELEQAVVELSNSQQADALAAIDPELAALQERIAQFEAKLIEQERTMRHTLTMLIEWIEGEDGSQIAA